MTRSYGWSRTGLEERRQRSVTGSTAASAPLDWRLPLPSEHCFMLCGLSLSAIAPRRETFRVFHVQITATGLFARSRGFIAANLAIRYCSKRRSSSIESFSGLKLTRPAARQAKMCGGFGHDGSSHKNSTSRASFVTLTSLWKVASAIAATSQHKDRQGARPCSASISFAERRRGD
jgi:hypothetical protein